MIRLLTILCAATISSLAAAEPTKLALIWNGSPAPHKHYVMCGDPKATDFCVPASDWVGICTTTDKSGHNRSLISGTIKINASGAVAFTGCADYEALITAAKAQELGITSKAAIFASNGCSLTNNGRELHGYTVGTTNYFYAIDGEGQFAIMHEAQTVPKADLCDIAKTKPIATARMTSPIRLGIDAVKLAKGWSADLLGDLNGDGIPELIFHAGLAGYYPEDAALLASAGPDIKALAATVTQPDLALGSPERQVVHEVENARDECQHWGGEEAYDEARRKEIEEGAKKSCAAYAEALKKALKRYPKNKTLKALRTP